MQVDDNERDDKVPPPDKFIWEMISTSKMMKTRVV